MKRQKRERREEGGELLQVKMLGGGERHILIGFF